MWRTFLKGVLQGGGFIVGCCSTILLAVTISGNVNQFVAGDLVSAAQINENFTSLQTALESTKEPPIGTIQAWHRDFLNTPSLPDGWLECNGQTVADADSVYNGQTLPDLNTSAHFLRGTTGTTGTFQSSANLQHVHNSPSVHFTGWVGRTVIDFGTGSADQGFRYGIESPSATTWATRTYNTNYSGGSESRPINMSIVWIMRVK